MLLALGASDASGATELVTPSAPGLTFEQTGASLSGAAGVAIYLCKVPSGGFSGSILVSVPGGATIHESLFYTALEITGHNSAAPWVRASSTSGTGITSLTVEQGPDSAATALNVAVGMIQSAQVISGPGWLQASDTVQDSSPARAMRVFYDEGTDDGIVLGVPVATNIRGAVVELAAGDGRRAELGWAEMEVPSTGTDNKAQVSFAEMEVPDAGVPAVLGWEQSDLDGGGGINAVAVSDDGTWLLCGGDISGLKSSIDGGVTWATKSRGLPDGGQPKVAGGIAIRPGSTTEAIAATSYGLYVTVDKGATWAPVENNSALSFGDGGGPRPRTNVGSIIGSSATYAFAIDVTGGVHRYRWSTGVLTKNLVPSRGGAGEGCLPDPINPSLVYVATRTGIWRIGSADGSATVTAFNGAGTPTGSYDLAVCAHNGTTYLFAVLPGGGVYRNVGGATGGAWTNIQPQGQAWQTVAAVSSGGGVVLAALCNTGPAIQAGKFAQYWYTNNAQAGSPSWTPLIDFRNEKGGPGGDPWWSPLGLGSGGKTAASSNTPVRDSNHSGEDASWFLRGGTYWLLVGGQQGCFIANRATDIVYPSVERLGVTANNHTIADPNTPGRFFTANSDHVILGTEDGGDRWFQLEHGITLGSQPVANDLAMDADVSPSRLYIAHGHRDLDQDGDVFYHANPFSFAQATQLGIASAGHAAYGIEVFRGANPAEGGTERVFCYVGFRNLGLRRQILTTANPPTKVGGLTVISNDACNSSPLQQRFTITWMDDDTLLVFDPTKGVYVVKSARAATPTIWKAWSVISNESAGANWIERVTADKAIISIGIGPDRGVYILEGLSSALQGQQF